MAITEGSFSLLSQSQSTRVPADGFLKLGEPYVNAQDGTLWIGSLTDRPLEIGLNCKTGLISETGKYLNREAGTTEINIPYVPTLLLDDQYFEFFILFSTIVDNPAPTYSQPVSWGSIPDPFPSMSTGKLLYVKFFSYGLSTSWNAIPVWSDDTNLTFFNGGGDNKFYYTQVQNFSGFTVAQRTALQFQGSGVTVFDDSLNDRTIVEISGGGSGSSGGVTSFKETFGDGVATTFSFSHNYGTRDVSVYIYRNNSPYDQVFPSIEHTDANTVDVDFGLTAPGTDEFRILIVQAFAPYKETFGDGVATTFAIVHSFGTRDVQVYVYRNTSPYDQVFPTIEHTDANTVTLDFGLTAPLTDEFRVLVTQII